MFSCDGFTAGGQAPVAVALGKDLEVGDRILLIGKKGIQLESGAKLEPGVPICVLAFGVVLINCVLHQVVDNAEVTAEFVLGSKWQSCQGSSCGNVVVKRLRSCESVRSQDQDALSAITFDSPGM